MTIWESGAILLYLAEQEGRLMPKDQLSKYKAISWIMFQMSGIGPMQGQANVFLRYAPTKIPYAIERYQQETRRLYKVLENQLAQTTYLVGHEITMADICIYPWVRAAKWAGIDLTKEEGFTNLSRWASLMRNRPAVQRGIQIPDMSKISKEQLQQVTIATGAKLAVGPKTENGQSKL
eukprot:TRINITY_DN5898_c0_g2_i1.p1 TRINITY_DN5898_c0_g2~~TRINITY_DN5898_c0_g2_i1.p1  ORF type:complete len:178 (-),score=21.13 TRINITY_DN5898_c0_g2_i1:71-604(-)